MQEKEKEKEKERVFDRVGEKDEWLQLS